MYTIDQIPETHVILFTKPELAAAIAMFLLSWPILLFPIFIFVIVRERHYDTANQILNINIFVVDIFLAILVWIFIPYNIYQGGWAFGRNDIYLANIL